MRNGVVHVQQVEVVLPQLHPGQVRLSTALDEARYVVAMCGRRVGKTEFGIERACREAIRGKRVGWFAPTYKIAYEGWQYIMRLSRQIPLVQISRSDKVATFPNGGTVEVRSVTDRAVFSNVVVCAGRETARLARSVGLSLPVRLARTIHESGSAQCSAACCRESRGP